MIRFKLALAGIILIVPALAPAQDTKPSEPTAPVPVPAPPEPVRFYLDSELVPFGNYLVAHPGSPFAIPTTLNAANPAREDPLEANFGLRLAPADDALRAQLEIPAGRGVVVVGVKGKGLAEQAGLKPNDILVKLGDLEVDGVETASKALLGLGREALEVKLIREGKSRRMSLVGPEHGFPPEAAEFWIGVPVSQVDPTLRSHLPALGSDLGLIANDVVKGSPAEAAGLLKNDILTAMGGKPLRNAGTLIEQIQATRGRPAPLEVLRGGKSITIDVTPAKRAHPTTINLPGSGPKTWAYRLVEPGVAVEVDPARSQEERARRLADEAGRLRDRELWVRAVRPLAAGAPLPQPDLKYDAIVVNPYRVDGSALAGTPNQPLDIRLQMAPRVEARDAEATARIEARLNDISAKLEEIRKALDGIKKADGK